ncbi:uncharacterized protein TNCV_5095901 [Trichonephila clavipes]|nr:uncharacterized protein TNCV_5095901 [Trichonephila clavipes]
MNEDHTTKKVFNAQPIATRRKGMSNLRWIDGLEKDVLALRTKNLRRLAGRRLASGKDFLRRPKPTLGCRATEEGRKMKKKLFSERWEAVEDDKLSCRPVTSRTDEDFNEILR